MSEANAYMHELASGPVPGMVYTGIEKGTSDMAVEVPGDK